MSEPRRTALARPVIAMVIGLLVGLSAGPVTASAATGSAAAGSTALSIGKAGSTVAGFSHPDYRFNRHPDVVASAQPTSGQPSASETQKVSVRLAKRTKANTTATSSAVCDGCAGTAVAVVDVHLPFRYGTVRADNVATAWSAGCQNCSAIAVSVQVVLGRSAKDVQVNNRALAVNAACTDCSTTAVAVQFVLLGGRDAWYSPNGRALAGQIADQILATITAPPVAAARSMAAETAGAPDTLTDAVTATAEQNRVALQRQFGAATSTVTVQAMSG
ncbi:hypothetical protein [Nakamurella lactea]|uniref:hypothetical protein n=1 Tax=Nakamurella lactea TaxID=459515 RepID=UPI0004218491|nr:hypothetical protein [Nakamurella lactea]